MTLRGSARGSYLEILPQQNQIVPRFSKISPRKLQETLKPLKIDPKSSPSPPKSSRNRAQIDPKSTQKASWRPSWTHVRKKLDFERAKNGQEASQRGQQTPQSVPTPSQMEAKTLPKQIWRQFLNLYFHTLHSHCLLIVSLNDSC